MDTDVLIIGGGLSGLSIADKLEAIGVDFLVVEAADQLGGRILTQIVGDASFDLGPAWFWPDQPRMARLINRFGLQHFDQYSDGEIVFQDQTGAVHPNRGFASMQGSYRIDGGISALIDGLQNALPEARIKLNTQVTSLTQTPHGIEAQVKVGPDLETINAQRVVLAVPPRIAAERIEFSPALPKTAMTTLANIPTWMAGQAKILAIYDQPYWREAGFSGDGMSQKGPMVEIHDASPLQGGPYALFGFVGFPAAMREQHLQEVLDLAQGQLNDMFGPNMNNPIEIKLHDWAKAPFIATQKDHTSPQSHPAYGTPNELKNLWSGNLLMASTEMGQQFGGFLEGALEAAEMTIQRLNKQTSTIPRDSVA